MNVIYRGFYRVLRRRFGKVTADAVWADAKHRLLKLRSRYPGIRGDARMMILPAAALTAALRETAGENDMELLKQYGTVVGKKIAALIHGLTSVPGVPELLWRNMPKLMRAMSSAEKGYVRHVVSESSELVGVDILSCPLHDAAVRIGMPEVAQVVCAIDKAYMTGFCHIEYTRTTAVAEGAPCCDYRLRYNKNKK